MQQSTNHKLSRRQFLQIAGTGATAAFVLAACPAPEGAPQAGGENSGGSAPSTEGAVVTVTAFGEADKNAFAAVADAYMEQNADVTVETNFLPNDESYYATLQTQYAGGSNPHIASMQGWAYQLFADNAVIVGVNALRERDDFNYAWADSEAIRQYTER
ncbi:MAG: twin-arginine translocation signal domain-containing protein, partial [Caldilineaceae bacterium]|nr:twin-arginine translocation signal domain-containing protein [Caldilineaceae bacterium]